MVMSHILDRLAVEPGLRDAWCAFHADEPIVHEFRGVWPRSMPEEVRTRRVFRVRVEAMWAPGLRPAGRGLVGIA